jgi:hypothetical protein
VVVVRLFGKKKGARTQAPDSNPVSPSEAH